MTLKEWDRTVAVHLQRIEFAGDIVGRRAAYIKAAVLALPCRPEWETKARAALDDVGAQLLAALKVISDARESYDKKPIIKENAA